MITLIPPSHLVTPAPNFLFPSPDKVAQNTLMTPSNDPRDAMDPGQIELLDRAFAEQLMACLDACARGRHGLFAEPIDNEHPWPEAARLRELAVALQSLLAQQGERNALADEFLDLCTMAGEAHPGERRLARQFLERIERGEVGAPTQKDLPW